ncbi:MAG: hypothetical protein ABIK54_07620 [candidate division WOR-3 bacterium]
MRVILVFLNLTLVGGCKGWCEACGRVVSAPGGAVVPVIIYRWSGRFLRRRGM